MRPRNTASRVHSLKSRPSVLQKKYTVIPLLPAGDWFQDSRGYQNAQTLKSLTVSPPSVSVDAEGLLYMGACSPSLTARGEKAPPPSV